MKTSKLAKFFITNASDIAKVSDFDKQLSFSEFKQSLTQNKILNKLQTYRSIDYAMSPEDILVEKEDQCQMAYVILHVRSVVGIKNFNLLVERYIYERKVKDIAEKYGLKCSWCFKLLRKLRKQSKEIILGLLKDNTIDADMFSQAKGMYYARTPMIKVDYPFDSARKTFKNYRLYAGKHQVSTTCLAVEYIDKAFHDNKTICNYCGNQCSRKAVMEERMGGTW